MATISIQMLGKRVKDKISGFKGIAIEKIEYLNGCIQYKIQPRVKENGKFIEGQWFDEQQLTVFKTVEKKKTTKLFKGYSMTGDTGGPGPDSTPDFGKP